MSKNLPFQVSSDYKEFLSGIKQRIQTSRIKAALAVNQEMITFYWELGKMIIQKQHDSNWGDKLIEALAKDLKESFPNTQGFSRSNLNSMKKFAEAYQSLEIVQALPGQLPWTHNLVLLEKVKEPKIRIWYAEKALENGWSYRALMNHIKESLYEAQGLRSVKTTNLKFKLPSPQSQLVEETIKDPYKFHFLTIGEDALEKEIHKGLLEHIKQFLMALGTVFGVAT